ncbi:MAG: methylenetetrahydrofolate reductase, partial [Thermoleophilaceae bacterium]|nr:methylenetetrahydrofolate reductase [Thermoleophilaceae bacterium]
VHPAATSTESDIGYLKQKVDAGAKFLITQLFFDNEHYFDFVARARAAGIEVPIIPGVMPVTNFSQLKRFTEMCGATIPSHLECELEARQDDPDAVRDLGVAYATLQCSELLARGAPGIHFYVLNRAPVARSVLAALRAARPWARPLARV